MIIFTGDRILQIDFDCEMTCQKLRDNIKKNLQWGNDDIKKKEICKRFVCSWYYL